MAAATLLEMFGGTGTKAYIFTVVRDSAGTFTLPIYDGGTYDFVVDWGDGESDNITAHGDVARIHTYAAAGTYTISITGTIIGWRFNNGGDKTLYYETKSWGPLRLGNSNGYFFGCLNMTVTATDILDLTNTLTMQSAFNACASLTTISSINSWDWSAVTNIDYSLQDASSFDQPLSMNTASLVSAVNALRGATSFDQDLSGLDVTSLINATQFLQNVTLSVANYNALIVSWSAQVPIAVGVEAFHGGNSKYTTGGAVMDARNAWVTKGWTLTDGGENVGAELITVAADRDFSSVTGNWVVTGGEITFDNTDCDWNVTGNSTLVLDLTVDEGALYRFEVEVTAYTSGGVANYVGTTGEAGWVDSLGVHVNYLTCGAFDYIRFFSANFVGSIDNISLKEVL